MIVFEMIYQNKIILIIASLIICCFWLFTIISFSFVKIGGNSIRIVEQQKRHEKQNSWMDNSISSGQIYSPTSFVARAKREVKEIEKKISFPTAGIAKINRQTHLKPAFGNSYASPESIYLYQKLAQQQLASPGQLQAQLSGGMYPVLLLFQQQSRPAVYVPVSTNEYSIQSRCFLSQSNSPYANAFYCANIPVPTYQFPEVPGITDVNLAVQDHTNRGTGDQSDFVGAQFVNPFKQIFKELTEDCPVNYYQCSDGSKCVARLQWCDNHVDCPDASDETKCTCRERIARNKLCDNYYDCPHGEDELGCYGCPKNSFSCNDSTGSPYNKGRCISQAQRCDGTKQCSNGRDEQDCSILTESYTNGNEMFPVGYTIGFLHKNWQGKWYPVCGHAYTWAKDACVSELGIISEEPEIEMVILPNQREIGPYLMEDGYSGKIISDCSDQMTYVRCPRIYSDSRFALSWPVDDVVQLVGSTGPMGNVTNTSDPIVSIVGGHDSSPRAWPFVVAINKNGHFHCGGAILSEWWILSAAHCFADYQRQYYEIDAGMLRRFSYSPAQQLRRLDGVIVHPNYDPMILRNDIALGLLNEPLLLNSWVRPVRLPEPGGDGNIFGWGPKPSPGDICVAVGWGATREGGSDPDHLREVEVPIINCRHIEDRNRAEICAGYREGGSDACQGDSGGPLMCRSSDTNNPYWYIGGIVSHGIGCGRRNEPGAYTKVSHFVDWITSITNSRRGLGALNRPRTVCPGYSCNRPYARCLPTKQRCDRIPDCLEAEDEINCPGFRGLLEQLLGQPREVLTTMNSNSPTSVK